MKKIILFFAVILLPAVMWAADFSGGSGTKDNPYLIANREQLDNLRKYLGKDYQSKYYRLTADIDLSGSDWVPIGNSSSNAFQGKLDGDGHKIFNLNIGQNDTRYRYTGLFGYLYNGASVKNLHIASGKLKGGGSSSDQISQTGSIAGVAILESSTTNITIANCSNRCEITGGDNPASSETGGIVGRVASVYSTASIYDCINYGDIIGGNTSSCTTGGLFGFGLSRYNNGTLLIDRCANVGNIAGKGISDSRTGGIIGYCISTTSTTGVTVFTKTTISKCMNSGNVIGGKIADTYVGGIVGLGHCDGSVSGGVMSVAYLYINDCYSCALIYAGDGNVGGIAGGLTIRGATSGDVNRCYASGNVIGNPEYAGSLLGHTSKNIYQSVAATANIQGRNVHRIQGSTLSNGRKNLYANKDMLVNGNKVTSEDATSVEGTDKALSELYQQATYANDPMNWVFSTIWAIRSDNTTLPYFQHQAAPVVVESLGTKTVKFNLSATSDSVQVYRYTAKNGMGYMQTIVKPTNAAKGYLLTSPVTTNDTLAFVNYDNTATQWAPSYPVYARVTDNNINITYTVTFDTKGGNKIASLEVEGGKTINQPTNPVRDGYTFGGWFKDEAYKNAWNFNADVVESNLTLYAKWTRTGYYIVMFDTQGGNVIDPIEIKAGEKITLPNTPTREGYLFGGWYKETGCINSWNFNTDVVSANITLYAKWTEIVYYTVTFDTKGGNAIDPVKVQAGEKVTPPNAPTREGYNFGGWFTDEVCKNAWTFGVDAVDGDITLYAKWTDAGVYTVIFQTNGSAAIAPAEVKAGDKVTPPSTPVRDGYDFGGWFKDETCKNAWNFDTDVVNNNITLYALWTQVLGVADMTALDALVYPNPATAGKEFYIRLQEAGQGSTLVEIYHASGKLVAKTTTSDHLIRMTTPSAPGVYYVRIVNGKQASTYKLVVE